MPEVKLSACSRSPSVACRAFSAGGGNGDGGRGGGGGGGSGGSGWNSGGGPEGNGPSRYRQTVHALAEASQTVAVKEEALLLDILGTWATNLC